MSEKKKRVAGVWLGYCSFSVLSHDTVDCIVTMDKNFGKIGRKIAEISFFGEPRKEKRMENSSARKIGKKSALSAIFRRKIGNFRFFHRKFPIFRWKNRE